MIENNVFNSESNIYKNNFDIFIDLKFEDVFPDFNSYKFTLTEKKSKRIIIIIQKLYNQLIR